MTPVMPTLRQTLCLLVLCAVQPWTWAWAGDAVTTLGPGVAVNTTRREVHLDATVCLRRGILEYLICKARTFEHESIFATSCKPSHLHAALLLIGAEPLPDADTYTWAEKVGAHAPSLLAIAVEFEHDGVRQRKPISSFVTNRERKDGVVADRWVFAGSAFYQRDGQELYAADSTGGVIGLTPKGASVVQFGERLGIPYQGEDQGLECNQDALPPIGTAVRVILSPQPVPEAKQPPTGPVAHDLGVQDAAKP